MRGDPDEAGDEEFEKLAGGVSGISGVPHDDGEDADDGGWEWGVLVGVGLRCSANPGTGDVVDDGSGMGVFDVEAAALAALLETIALG